MASRANQAVRAVRPRMAARIMLSGVAGSGKTLTGLEIARELVGPSGRITLIDTEFDSALTYADVVEFEHLPWHAPYSPYDLTDTMKELSAAGTAVVIDSGTHFWTGEGGVLSIADSKFGGWKVATPAQDDMVASILTSSAHVIFCVREKAAYAATMRDGKQVVEKLGMEPQQRGGLDYEFNVHLTMNTGHTIAVAKTRCRSISGREFPPNHALDFAAVYGDWLRGGQPLATKEQRAEIGEIVNAITDPETRKRVQAHLIDTFGPAKHLLESDVPEAMTYLAPYRPGAEAEAVADVVAHPEDVDIDPADLDEVAAAAFGQLPGDEPGPRRP